MNKYWKEQAGLTPNEKRAFVDRVKAENAAFLGNLRTIHSAAENRMLTRVCTEKWADRANKLIDMFDNPKLPTTSGCIVASMARGPDDVVPDADDSSIQRGMLK